MRAGSLPAPASDPGTDTRYTGVSSVDLSKTCCGWTACYEAAGGWRKCQGFTVQEAEEAGKSSSGHCGGDLGGRQGSVGTGDSPGAGPRGSRYPDVGFQFQATGSPSGLGGVFQNPSHWGLLSGFQQTPALNRVERPF